MKHRKNIELPIVQFWMQGSPPSPIHEFIEAWHDSFRVRHFLFDDEMAIDFIKKNFDAEILTAYESCNIPAMRADYFRYCYLYVNGGVYVDADVELKNGEFFDEASCRGLLFIRNGNIANDFMVVTQAEDPLIQRILEAATSNISSRAGTNVWAVTGPGIATHLKKIDDGLFSGFNIVSIEEVSKYVRFVGGLDYKRTDVHWTLRKDLFK